MKLPPPLVAAMLAALMVSGSWAVEKTSLVPPVHLPDGQEFKTWETPRMFSQTYYVAQSHPKASDDNPGTEALPFKTINRAAQVLQPGQRVVVAAGTYREQVRPARGGTEPNRMISYEAAPGANVIISGSAVLEPKWTPSTGDGKGKDKGLWTIKLPASVFIEDNPFTLQNLTDELCMPWAVSTKGQAPNTLRRGLVFLNGRRLRQVAAKEELATINESYWVEKDGLIVHLNLPEGKNPNQMQTEITVRGAVFFPAALGLGYLCVKGFTIEHAANPFPMPQLGALSVRRGHHWIIEDNTVRQCNSIGMDIGFPFGTTNPPLAEGGQHIVRHNTVTHCGIGGIEGGNLEHTLIEENRFFGCGWQRAEAIWETGAIKVHGTLGVLIRKNVIQDSIGASGIWMDAYNRNSRCTQNLVIGTETMMNGGIYMEASQTPNLVDHNIVWGSTMNGIVGSDSDELVIAHNLIGHCKNVGILTRFTEGRTVGGRLTTAKRNRILNNVMVDNEQMLAISDPDNICDWNLFGASQQPFDLTKWQKSHGWDQNSTMADIRASFNPKTLELTWSVRGKIPKGPLPPGITFDFLERPYCGRFVPPGPFEAIPAAPTGVPLNINP